MKLKTLLLPALAASLMACGGDSASSQNESQPTEPPQPPVENTNPGWLEPGAKGDVSTLGGATRLKQDRSHLLQESLRQAQAKNVILLIGDGTSHSEITAARNYAEGAAGYFKGLDVLPFTGSYTTYALNRNDGSINYVTDSAASATAWATGIKTYNNALGVDIYGDAYPSIMELAKQAGKATGNVTTTELQDATPAALYAKISARKCYGPSATADTCPESALENGGLGSITEQLIATRADVTLGGGAATFNEVALAGTYEGATLLEQAEQAGYQLVNDIEGLNKLTYANQSQPVLGLFAEGNLPVIWSGPTTSIDGNLEAPASCGENINFDVNRIPTLKRMTEKAIELLKDNPEGFFLQVESGSIDKRNHAADPCGQIGETVQLDQALQVALEFAREDGETLVIVTGDHAHTSQIIPIRQKSPGRTVALITKDGVPMGINYGAATGNSSQAHTGAEVRTAAYGPLAANISGLLDQTDLFFIMKNALGLSAQPTP